MRADRLLAMMLMLQGQGKMTAKALAAELGVTRRTILRDVEALSIAGIPIYAEGGHGGGIALDEQYRTTLTGLHAPEVQSLFIASNSAVLRDVGLGEASEHLLLKLFAALPVAHRPTVDHIRQRLLIDPAWWWSEANTPPFWDELQRAVYEDHTIDVRYEHYQGEVVERTLEPYSLVSKSSVWYLVAARDGELRTYRVARIHALHVLERRFTRAHDYDLSRYWTEHLQSFTETFAEYRCTLRVHPERVAFIKWLLPGRWQALDDGDGAGWVTFRLALDSLPMAKMVVFGLGMQSVVIDPPELARAVREDAEALVRHLGHPESGYNPPVTLA